MKNAWNSFIAVALAMVFSIGFFNCASNKTEDKLTFGIIADVHQDLQANARERLQVFIDEANNKQPDFIVQLGDLSHGQQPILFCQFGINFTERNIMSWVITIRTICPKILLLRNKKCHHVIILTIWMVFISSSWT